MTFIRDMLFVNGVERELGRRLTEEEMDGEAHLITFPGGRTAFIQVPMVRFPHDLLSKPEETFQLELEELMNAA